MTEEVSTLLKVPPKLFFRPTNFDRQKIMFPKKKFFAFAAVFFYN
jgi:hypothetical protein